MNLRNAHWKLHFNKFLLFVVIVLSALTADGVCMDSASSLPGNEVDLKTVPELQHEVSGNFPHPTAVELLNVVQENSKLKFSLDKSVIQNRPLQGHTKFQKVPAWAVLRQLAGNRYIQGQWRRVGLELRLYASYSGQPPPLPIELSSKTPESRFGDTVLTDDKAQKPRNAYESSNRWFLIGMNVLLLLGVAGFIVWNMRRAKKQN